MKVYITLMRRYGEIENHAYILGAFDTIELATEQGYIEKENRANKYEFEIHRCELNNICEKEVEVKLISEPEE